MTNNFDEAFLLQEKLHETAPVEISPITQK